MAAPDRSYVWLSWGLQLLAAAVFVMAGGKKLIGDPAMVEVFTTVGLGQWLRYLTGGLEVVCGLGLLLPRQAAASAATLFIVMVGAILAHLTVLGGNPLLAIVLLVACLIIVIVRRDTLPGR